MKLRKKAKYEIESYHKMLELRRESVKVLRILKDVWQRDGIKKSLVNAEEKYFELQFEQMLKEKGINNSYPKTNGSAKMIDLEKL